MFQLTRPRILVSKLFQATCLILVAITIFLTSTRSQSFRTAFGNSITIKLPSSSPSSTTSTSIIPPASTPIQETPATKALYEAAPNFINAITNPTNTTFPRVSCPSPDTNRYNYLRQPSSFLGNPPLPKYYFALNLHECVNLLPRLIGSVIEAIKFLGPENCVLSIVEGRSNDGTLQVLELLRPEMEKIGAKYHLLSSPIDPTKTERIAALADLRNLAMEPLFKYKNQYSPDTAVLFLNDVAICMEDILELLHQLIFQGADMTCGMDWTYVGHDPTFYDVWIARGMNGDTFFDIPPDGNWNSAWNIFWNNPKASEGYANHRSFQVFACWNGATVFTAKPWLEGKIRFRRNRPGECYQGEPKLFCKDLWRLGYGKIAVVPSVNLEYSDEKAVKIKAEKGYASQFVEGDNQKIEWEMNPPEKVKCMKGYDNQVWVPWNEDFT